MAQFTFHDLLLAVCCCCWLSTIYQATTTIITTVEAFHPNILAKGTKRVTFSAQTGTTRLFQASSSSSSKDETKTSVKTTKDNDQKREKVIIIGAGWGGLSAAYHLSKDPSKKYDVTVIDAASRVGGLVRDGFTSMNGKFPAEAGQHGFWDQYHNIFQLLRDDLNIMETALTDYAEQGQYSPKGLEAIWPIYRTSEPYLPTGLAQAAYTRFVNLPLLDRITAFPLVLAFSEFDDSPQAWEIYDKVSFRDLCIRLGVSKRCYEEAFEPMILTGLFAPGAECSAAAALGMAYFFVLSNQKAFDVRWCKGNIGEQIMDPWIDRMTNHDNGNPVKFQLSSRVIGFEVAPSSTSSSKAKPKISKVKCLVNNSNDNKDNAGEQQQQNKVIELEADQVIFAVGAAALNAMSRNSPQLSQFAEFRNFANLRGTSVLATRLYLDRKIHTPYTANACWGFDRGVGMTFFNIGQLHGTENSKQKNTNLSLRKNKSDHDKEMPSSSSSPPGSVIEVDYYHANTLLVMSDEQIVEKAKRDLNTMLGVECATAKVVDAAIVRLPNAVNWYFPGSYTDMPDLKSKSLDNVYFAGDIVRTRHGSWSQEKAYVTGIEAANMIRARPLNEGVLPLKPDEPHVAFGRMLVKTFQNVVGGGGDNKENRKAPSLLDFLF